jgi:DNA-binding CsgD family transcriptional regulator
VTRISHSDYERLSAALRELYAHTDFHSLPRFMISLQRRVVPCEISTYNEIDAAANVLRVVHDYPLDDAEKLFPQFMAHLDEYPISTHFAQTGDGSPTKMSDYLSNREFQRLGLYNEFYRHFGIRYQIAFFLPRCSGDSQILMGLQRLHRDYTERDRLILGLLSSHFEQAWQNARTLGQARNQKEQVARALGKMRQGLIFLTRERRVTWMTDLAKRCLEDYFGDSGSASVLPEALRRWVERLHRATEDVVTYVREPLVLCRGDRQLRIRWMSESADESWLVLAEEDPEQDAKSLAPLALTGREAEVLHWMAEGKSNPEIGAILGASPNTVRKHVEHILSKLNVESRGAAVRRVWDLRNST